MYVTLDKCLEYHKCNILLVSQLIRSDALPDLYVYTI